MATNAYPRQGAGATSDLDFRRWAGPLSGDGVLPLTLNAYEVFGDSSGRQVKVRPGRAYIRGLIFPLETQLTIPLDAGTGQTRIDAVVLRLTASGTPTGDPIVKKGTPGASPVAPTVTQTEDGTYEILLATVAVPAASSYVVSPSMVTDRRTFVPLGDTQQTIRLRSTADASLSSTAHAFQVGASDAANLIAGTNEIMARNNGAAVALFLQASGGACTIGNDDNSQLINLFGRVRYQSVADASPSSTDHAFQIGPSSGQNIVMDANELMSRSNGATSTLGLNLDGGDIIVGDSTSQVQIPGHVSSVNLPWAMASGVVTMPSTVAGATSTRTVALPLGRFSVAPIVQLTMHSSDPKLRSVGIGERTATDFEIKFANEGSTTVALNVAWTAIQMNSGAASG